MPLDRIALDHRGVASPETIRYFLAAAHDACIAHVVRLHTEAIGAQMIHPRAAAASVGIEVDVHVSRWRQGERATRNRCAQRGEKQPSVRHLHLVFLWSVSGPCPGRTS